LSVATGAALGADPVLSLDELVRNPELVGYLPREALLKIYRQAAHLEADLRAQLLAGPRLEPVAGQPLAVPAGNELTAEQVAGRINRPLGYVRELLRRRDLPGFRRGKYWVVPEADLLAWQHTRKGVDNPGSETLPSLRGHGTGGVAPDPEAARSYTVEVRLPSRGPCGHREKVGDRDIRDATH